MNKAKTKIIQHLDSLGFTFIEIRRPALLDRGDFENEELVVGTFRKYGNSKGVLYRYIDFKDKSNAKKTVTVKINWNVFGQTTYEYKPEIEKTSANTRL